MTLKEAVDILWEQMQKFFGPSDKDYLRRFMGAFVDYARSCYVPACSNNNIAALNVFADAKLRDVRAQLERLWEEINKDKETVA